MRLPNRTATILGLACFLLAQSVAWAGDLFQWTDTNGVPRFTDDLTTVPEAYRQSANFTVRKNFFLPPQDSVAKAQIEAPLPLASSQTTATNNRPVKPVAETFITDAPEEPIIVVINSVASRPVKKFCHGTSGCTAGAPAYFSHPPARWRGIAAGPRPLTVR